MSKPSINEFHEHLDALRRLVGPEPEVTSIAPIDTVALARSLLKLRSRRAESIRAELLGEPAWDILLELYVARAERREVSVSSACLATHVPQTTGLRYISALVDGGELVRRDDAKDGRRVFVEISATAADQVEKALSRWPRR